MKILDITYKGRKLKIRYEAIQKFEDCIDYELYDKNGYSFYIIRCQEEKWSLAYGLLRHDLVEVIIEELKKINVQ